MLVKTDCDSADDGKKIQTNKSEFNFTISTEGKKWESELQKQENLSNRREPRSKRKRLKIKKIKRGDRAEGK